MIPGAATQAGARNGFEEPRDRAAKIAGIATSRSTETTRPSFERRKSPQIGAYSSETGNRRTCNQAVMSLALTFESGPDTRVEMCVPETQILRFKHIRAGDGTPMP